MRIFTQQMSPGSSPRMWMGETEAWKCQQHNPMAWMPNGMTKCASCKTFAIFPAQSYVAIKCRTCSFEEMNRGRCCEFRS
jgi:hypothetical protein